MEIENGLEIKDCISLISGRVNATINRYLNRKFKESNLDLTVEQWSVMAILWEKDMQTQQYICDHTFKDKASITRLVDALERNGFVTRQASATDRRINLIQLTQKGLQTEASANKIIEESIDIATREISKEEFLNMTTLFKRIISNIEE